jgi:hypothetical protein
MVHIKDTLYSFCGKSRLRMPTYTTRTDKEGRTHCEVSEYFRCFQFHIFLKCQLRIETIDYTAIATGANVKEATTNAAYDFCQYLIREGKMKPTLHVRFYILSLTFCCSI